MGQQAYNYLNVVLILGTLLVLFLVASIIFFALLYQQKMKRKVQELHEVELINKTKLVRAELDAKEKEQRRIAIELHDDIGSSLTALKLSFANLPLTKEQKETVNDGIQQTINKVRSLSNQLLPTVLEELGLVAATRYLVKSLEKQIPDVKFSVVAVNDNPHPNQSKEVVLSIYRITQELLNNILKHAHATEISVTLEQNFQGVILSVTDNGNGFIPQHKDKFKKQSLGLKNIESRIYQINGEITYTLLNPGTKVKLIWNALNNDSDCHC